MFKKASPQSSNSPQNLDDVRRQSRHRLIGASLLVAAAVFGFPLVFDTQPRPISVDLPIHIPAQPAVSPLTPVAAAPSAPNVPAPAVVAPVKPVVKPAEKSAEKTADKPAVNPPAPAAKAPAKPDATGERFVVQVGAYADVASARTVRQKIERAGLKTYTQVAKTSQGNRIRVRLGPFTTRAEADKVAQKIKSLGLTPGVLTL